VAQYSKRKWKFWGWFLLLHVCTRINLKFKHDFQKFKLLDDIIHIHLGYKRSPYISVIRYSRILMWLLFKFYATSNSFDIFPDIKDNIL
jgi:hypothetical protein